jgi:D-alanine-D-alanine ligase
MEVLLRVAVVYNRESKKVINLFGMPNMEKYGLKAVERIVDSLKAGGHQATAFEGDKDIIDKLEDFMPQVLKGERPGMVFNISYGVQGQARYTHIPSILEMVGIPYVGSGPLAHSLSLDKVVAKMMFRQQGIPTPDFVVLDSPGSPVPDLEFPLIVKPKNEAVSMGIRIVKDEEELREASGAIFDKFRQPVLVERYIEGREINVGLLGNNPPELFAPAELIFEGEGPNIYTLEDKKQKSGRNIGINCPADISPELTAKAHEIALGAFNTLGCYDCARVDMRLDNEDNLYVLEINSLPSLGEHGSYVAAAEHMGLDFPALINRMVEVASARYFGTPEPPQLKRKKRDVSSSVFSYLTAHRDSLEQRVRDWTSVISRTEDPVGIQIATNKLEETMLELGMRSAKLFHEESHVLAWETAKGMDDGTLLLCSLDVPRRTEQTRIPFSKDPEWFSGEGVGSSRASIAMMLHVLRALKKARKLNSIPLGVLFYTDLGYECRYSEETIRRAAERARQVLVLWPGNLGNNLITQRRGQRKYLLGIEGRSLRLGQTTKSVEPLKWLLDRLNRIMKLSSKKEKVSVSALNINTEAAPMLLPHRIEVTILMSYLDPKIADKTENAIKEAIKGGGVTAALSLISDRPPMRDRNKNRTLLNQLKDTAEQWDIPLDDDTSLWPTVAGLVPPSVPVVCGVGPVARDLNTYKESVSRVSIMERTLLLAEFLVKAHIS